MKGMTEEFKGCENKFESLKKKIDGKISRAVIFLDGEPPKPEAVLKADLSNALVICTDGAYNYAREYVKPDMLVGDLDSLGDVVVPKDVFTEKFPVKKDYTDSQLAVIAASKLGLKRMEIYGAFGLRPDHALVNYSLLSLADSLGCEAVLLGGDFDVFFVTPDRPFIGRAAKDKIVSLVPYSDNVHILYTKGLQYSAELVDVGKSEIFTTSNASLGGEVEYRLKRGTALLFVEN